MSSLVPTEHLAPFGAQHQASGTARMWRFLAVSRLSASTLAWSKADAGRRRRFGSCDPKRTSTFASKCTDSQAFTRRSRQLEKSPVYGFEDEIEQRFELIVRPIELEDSVLNAQAPLLLNVASECSKFQQKLVVP